MRSIGFKTNQQDESSNTIVMPYDFQHGICIGMTGSGKTASLILPIMEDRIQKEHGLLIYTYKGHEHQKIKYIAQKANRLHDVIEVGKPFGKYINLMGTLELDAVQKTLEELIAGNSKNSDGYWTLSAARLGVNIVDILRKLHKIEMLIKKELNNIEIHTIFLKDDDNYENAAIRYEYPKGDPSFKTLAEIVKTPKTLKKFYSGLDKLVHNIREVITIDKLFDSNNTDDTYSLFFNERDEPSYRNRNLDIIHESFAKKIVIALLRLEKAIAPYKDFTIEVNSDSGTGNNGVLQSLNNAVLGLANKDYINIEDINLLEALNNKAIVIVDIESIDRDMHGILLESILKKLSLRIRNGKPSPVSIFIDEANRVLMQKTDIHNDTLRESNVELVLAIQNEEQMIEKFGLTKWESVKQNFKHNYHIDLKHQVSYNGQKNRKVEALLINEELLLDAEYAFNSLPENRNLFEERFYFEGTLPTKFSIAYDVVSFEKHMCIDIVDDTSQKKEVEYIGNELKEKLEFTMIELGYNLDINLIPEIKIAI